jgi:hypothetical protein
LEGGEREVGEEGERSEGREDAAAQPASAATSGPGIRQ